MSNTTKHAEPAVPVNVDLETGEVVSDEALQAEYEQLGQMAAQASWEDLEQIIGLDEQAWRPRDPGASDTIMGTVWAVVEAGQRSEFGTYPMVQIVTPTSDGIVNVHAFHTVLRSAVERQAPAPGDRIAIKYLGRTTKGGFQDKGYENYRLILSKPRLALTAQPLKALGS